MTTICKTVGCINFYHSNLIGWILTEHSAILCISFIYMLFIILLLWVFDRLFESRLVISEYGLYTRTPIVFVLMYSAVPILTTSFVCHQLTSEKLLVSQRTKPIHITVAGIEPYTEIFPIYQCRRQLYFRISFAFMCFIFDDFKSIFYILLTKNNLKINKRSIAIMELLLVELSNNQ